ncbi:MAG: BlaI/MecI/CopY family transcriptional regulator [Lachnospiraceae bacterium]|nr:BlaI/MecI/CopY family transcriptional regulator [Lachnospiraceae bacterium]
MQKEQIMPMLSDGEFEIMECVWCSEKAPTQTGIMRWVNEKNNKTLKVATIATYIRRIMWKGYLEKIDKNDGHPVYHALVSRDEYFARTSDEFYKRWGVGRVFQLAANYFVKADESAQEEFINTCNEMRNK